VAVGDKPGAKWGLNLQPKVTITLDLDNHGPEVLEEVNKYFGNSGRIAAPSKGGQELVFRQTAVIKYIIPFLKDHPLMGGKAKALAIMIKVIELKASRAHHDQSIMARILLSIYEMNEASQRTEADLIKWFSNLPNPKLRGASQPLEVAPLTRTKLSPQYVLGVISGDGGFSVVFNQDANISLYFSVTADLLERGLLEALKEYLGGIGSLGGDSYSVWIVIGNNQIMEVLIPFIDKLYNS